MDYKKLGNKDLANCFIPWTFQSWAPREDAGRTERTLDRKGAGYPVKCVHFNQIPNCEQKPQEDAKNPGRMG